MASGGARVPTPGTNYTNRTDLAVQTAPGQQYDAATQQAQAQRTVPMSSGPAPGSLTPLDAPTQRPNEPVTHGVSSGPGAGPEVLGTAPNDLVAKLTALYNLRPNRDLYNLIVQEQINQDRQLPTPPR